MEEKREFSRKELKSLIACSIILNSEGPDEKIMVLIDILLNKFWDKTG